MPIYAYKCESCGFAKDVLRKMSDQPLTDCPACGASSFKKQLTAAGFQLKGSGWYATDFKGAAAAPASAASSTDGAAATPATTGQPSESPAAKSEPAPVSAAGACGGACH